MADKRRYTVTLPDHVADAVEGHAKPLGATPTEYAADVLRWWFGQGCPPVTHDEAALIATDLAKRIKQPAENLSVWALDPTADYHLIDAPAEKMLVQLGLPNLFARSIEHDQVRMMVVFDNHPTHWIEFDYFKGGATPAENGLAFTAYPKASVTRHDMLRKMRDQAKKMDAPAPAGFSQIPMLEKSTSDSGATPRTLTTP